MSSPSSLHFSQARGRTRDMPQSEGTDSYPNSVACTLGRPGPTELQSPRYRKGTVGPSPILAWPLSQDFSIHWIRSCCPASEQVEWEEPAGFAAGHRQEKTHPYSAPQHLPTSTEPFASPRKDPGHEGSLLSPLTLQACSF